MPSQPSCRPTFSWVRALALTALLATPLAHAAPGENSDPVTRFLAEKGLLSAATAASGAAQPSGPNLSALDAADPVAAFAKQASGQSSPGLVQQMRDRASDMVLTAMNFLGVPYKRGGESADTGFDCSGFTRHIFEMSVGLVLPRRADEQAKLPTLLSVKRDELKPGDLVFFNTLKRTFSHVGIYVGEGKFIHSPRSGSEVRVEDMRQAYWTKRFTGARRAPQVAATPPGGTPANAPSTQSLVGPMLPPAAAAATPAHWERN